MTIKPIEKRKGENGVVTALAGHAVGTRLRKEVDGVIQLGVTSSCHRSGGRRGSGLEPDAEQKSHKEDFSKTRERFFRISSQTGEPLSSKSALKSKKNKTSRASGEGEQRKGYRAFGLIKAPVSSKD